jgi:putative ABC transport system permease protein
MRDWEAYVRSHLALPGLQQERESRIVRELASQLEDFYRDARVSGQSEADADAFARGQITDWTAFAANISRADAPHARSRADRWAEQFDNSARSKGRTGLMIADLWQDIRYAGRQLASQRGFTAVAVLTMALAVGANTAVFSIVYGVLFRPLPFPDSHRLVVLGHQSSDGRGMNTTSPGNFYDWQARTTAFEAMAAFAYTERVVSWGGGEVERMTGVLSAGSLFDVLRRPAAEGRTFTAADDDPGAAPVVVVSASLAERMFGSGAAVGRALEMGGLPVTVIGVMPKDFSFADQDAQYWMPARYDAGFRGNRDQFFLRGIARLRPGVSLDEGRSQLDTVMDAIRRDFPQHTGEATAAVAPLRSHIVEDARPRLLTLLGAVVAVLLIACANLANLLLARGAVRRRELAVRHALGASSLRLVRQLLVESLLVAALGGLAGIGLGAALLRVLVGWLPDDLPRADGIALDPTALAVTLGVCVGCALLFGLWPAWQQSADATVGATRDGTRGSARTHRMRTGLVVAEVALSLVLLVASGLLVRSFVNLMDVQPGFDSARLLTFSVSLPPAVYRTPAERLAYFTRTAESLRALPGVTDVVMSSTLPVAGRGVGAWFNMLDNPLPPDRTPPSIPYRVVSPNYFSALGIPVMRGRSLTADDSAGGPRAVVISESVARRFWPDGSALRRRIYLGAPENRLFPDAEVVGVVGDVKQTGLHETTSEAVYIPQRMMPFRTFTTFAVRTAVPPSSIASAVRAELGRVDPGIPMHNVRTMDEILAQSLAPARSSMYLVGLFGALAVVLAVVGVFGVLSYSVSQRRLEMAIRIALGASARSVMLLVLGQGMRQVGFGIALGLAGCVVLTRYLQELLFHVRPADPLTLVIVSMALGLVSAAAIAVPGRRAARVDPLEITRES